MKKRLPLLLSFILFVVLCVSVAFWGMQFFRPPVRAIAPQTSIQAPEPSLSAGGTLFGGRMVEAAASNFQLKGVVAARPGNEGVAILSADGKPAQAVGIGKEISPGVSLKEVHPQYVLLSEGGVVKRVDLPEGKSQARSEGLLYAPPMPTPGGMPMPGSMPMPGGMPMPNQGNQALEPPGANQEAPTQTGMQGLQGVPPGPPQMRTAMPTVPPLINVVPGGNPNGDAPPNMQSTRHNK